VSDRIPVNVQEQLASRRWPTSKAYEALSVDSPVTVVLVPQLDVPWRDEAQDRKGVVAASRGPAVCTCPQCKALRAALSRLEEGDRQ
jgi:hypothetical protein